MKNIYMYIHDLNKEINIRKKYNILEKFINNKLMQERKTRYINLNIKVEM